MSKGVGVYIGRDNVVAVSAVSTVKGPQVKAYAIEPVNPGGDGPAVGKEAHKLRKLSPESRAIRKALETIKEPGAFVTASVSPFHIVTRHFMMPAVPKKEKDDAVRFEASRYIPFKLSESVLDYHEQITHRNVYSITATAIKKEVLQQALSDLRGASAKVLMIEPVHSAVGRVFASLNMFQKVKTCGFVTLQSDGNVNLTFVSKGTVYLSRDFLLSEDQEENKSHFFDELKASLDYFYKLTGGEAVTQIFVAGHGDLKFWVEHLEHAFNYAMRFDLATFPEGTPFSADIMDSIFIAYGLALRSAGYSSLMGEPALLPPAERRMKPKSFYSLLGGCALGVMVLFLLVRLVVFQPYVGKLTHEYQKVLGPGSGVDSSVVEMSVESLDSRKVKLASQAKLLADFEKKKSLPGELLMALGRNTPAVIRIDYISIENTTGGKGKLARNRMTMRGGCVTGNAEQETAAIDAWIQQLQGEGAFKSRFSEFKLEEVKREREMEQVMTQFKVVGE